MASRRRHDPGTAHNMTTQPTAPAAPARDPLYLRGVGLVLVSGCVLSIAGIVVRLMDSANEWQILFYRSLSLIATLLLVLALRNRGRVLQAFRVAGMTGVVGGLFLSLAFTGFIFSLTHTTVANSLFLLSVSPFMAAALGWIVLGERVRRATWLAICIAVAGVGVMVVEGIGSGGLLGNVTALGSALGFAGFTVALRWGKTRDMLPTVCIAALITGAVAAVMAPTLGSGFAISPHDLLLCFVLGAVQLGLGLAIYTLGSRHVPAAELSLLSLTEVVLGPVWAWFGVGEAPSELTLFGGAIVLAAIAVHALSGLRRWRPPTGAV